MALNACSINSFTIDAGRCRDKFADLIPILHPPIVTISGTNPRVLRDTFRRPDFDVDDRPPLVYEQPIVSVTAEIFGFSGTDTQDVSAVNTDFVSVTEFNVDDASVIVNIFDFTIE